MNSADPRGLDYPFRQKGLELIKTRLNDLAQKTNSPVVLDTINTIANKFEGKIFERATSKQDYVFRIERKLSEAVNQHPAASTTGNQLRSFVAEPNPNVFSTQYQPSRVHVPATLSTMQPTNMAVHNNQFGQQNHQFGHHNQQFVQQNQQFGQQNVVQREIRNPLAQQNSIRGSYNQVGNGQTQYMTYQSSQSQYSGPVVSAHEQRNQFQVTEMPSTTGASALAPFSDAGNTNTDQFQHLIVQFQRARSLCLPELHKWLKNIQGQFNQAQTVGEREKFKKPIVLIQQMIRFLKLPENQLMLLEKQKLRHHLNGVIDYYNQTVKRNTSSAVNQLQFSSLQRLACPNVTQNTQTAPIPTNQPLVSSSTINHGFSNSHSSAADAIDIKSSMLHSVTQQGSADHNTHLNIKKDPQIIQASHTIQTPEKLQSVNLPEKRKHPMDSASVPVINNVSSHLPEMRKDLTDSTSKPSTNNAPSRISKKPFYRPKAQLSGNSHDSWLNLASLRSTKRSIPTKLCQSSSANNEQKMDTQPSTPMTPSSVKSGVLDSPAENICQTEILREESNSLEQQPELEDLAPLLGTPEILTCSPMVSDCTGPESTTQQPSEKQPIDRLLDVLKSASKETLVSAVNDMRSAIIEMDDLPEYAYLDDDDDSDVPTLDNDLAEFIETLNYNCKDDEHQQQPNTKLQREFESVSRDASFPPDNHNCTQSNQQSSKLEPNQKLLDEISDTNQKLYSTVIKAMTDSSDQNNGTIVRVTYRPIAVSTDILRSMFATESINLSVEFMVPFDYPSSLPKILGCKLPDIGIAIEMTELTKSLFDTKVSCVDALKVGEMAEVWDVCARSTFVAYAKRQPLFGPIHDQF